MRTKFKSGTFLRGVSSFLLASASAHAASVSQTNGVGLKGYDPVTYFTEHKAVEGSEHFTAKFRDATHEFESASNGDAFNVNPLKGVPQYGGYCAYGAARRRKADISPDAFTIVNGKLYLNYNRAVRFLWNRDVPGYITKADQNWSNAYKTADSHQPQWSTGTHRIRSEETRFSSDPADIRGYVVTSVETSHA